ncbi:MAG: FecR domain-containing protein [Bacteroidota bacterium]
MQHKFETYASFTEEDYLEDQHFRHWVLRSNTEPSEWWQGLFARYPEQKQIAEQARVLLLNMKEDFQAEALGDNALDESFISELKHQLTRERSAKVSKMNRGTFIQRLAIAASIAFILGAASWKWLIQPNGNMRIISTAYSEWKTQTLPDGSEVKLNANSEIRFAKNWTQGEHRTVWLSGEAFFDVAKDSLGATFSVITEDLEVEVLGTAFNVHCRGKQTGVFLQEGTIRLDLGENEKLMIPGEYIAYSAPQKKITEYELTASETLASWKEGSLILEDETVKSILDKIAEIYGYEVVVHHQKSLAEQKTIAIPMDKIEIAIPILEKTLGVKIQITKDQLIIE